MIFGTIDIIDLILYHKLSAFMVFFIASWSIFGYRLFLRRKNVKYTGQPVDSTTSAIVVTFKDKMKYFRASLESLRKQSLPFTEVILAMDKRENEENMELARQYASKYGFKIVLDDGGNKRTAFYAAFKQSTGQIVYILAGDTVYPENTVKETLIPFNNSKVGGTTIKQRIFDKNASITRHFADIMYNLRFLVPYPALSAKGDLVCTTGEIGAFRRELLEKHMDEYLNETFWGKRCVLGDDRYLTSIILQEGYDVVLQPTQEAVMTDAPDNFRSFCKQQLRWYRSGQKYCLKTVFQNWIPNRSKLLRFHCAVMLFMPYLFVGVVLAGIVFPFPSISLLVGDVSSLLLITLSILGFYLATSIKSLIHLKDNKEDWLVFPAYAVFCVFVVLPIFIYASFTLKKQGEWLTK